MKWSQKDPMEKLSPSGNIGVSSQASQISEAKGSTPKGAGPLFQFRRYIDSFTIFSWRRVMSYRPSDLSATIAISAMTLLLIGGFAEQTLAASAASDLASGGTTDSRSKDKMETQTATPSTSQKPKDNKGPSEAEVSGKVRSADPPAGGGAQTQVPRCPV